ncbi:MAG: selenide, water dikinase SelD [Anaerolineales bacterium]|nr:selenide, water dikinase SelD [Anaerolineales bacterium]
MEGIFNPIDTPDLLVGLSSLDDAAVWRLDETRSLIVTTDFFTPIVDDPYTYGAIAAANAISDIYAMGGEPFLALNIAAFPKNLPVEILSEILKGGAEKAKEAGVVIAGGHTICDDEPKFGLIVLGFATTGKTLTKGGLQEGDLIYLTKPLGIGTTTTAIKQQKAKPDQIIEAVSWMTRLNRDAAKLANALFLTTGTDVTGYSFLGHASEMVKASGKGIEFKFSEIPFMSCAEQFAHDYIFPGGAFDNKEHFGQNVDFDININEPQQLLLFDPQTSGGLLLSVPREKNNAFLETARELNQPVWQVGEVIPEPNIHVNP